MRKMECGLGPLFKTNDFVVSTFQNVVYEKSVVFCSSELIVPVLDLIIMSNQHVTLRLSLYNPILADTHCMNLMLKQLKVNLHLINVALTLNQ